MVTRRSFIAWSRAACVLGGVRLISSASRSCVKIGPLVSTKLLVWKLNRLVPSTSPGIRSGVNWMRPNFSVSAAAKACASNVLAVPGTPSSRTWPPTRRLVSIRSMASSWPTTAFRTSSRIPSVTARMSWNSINDLPLPSIGVACERRQRSGVTAAVQITGAQQQRGATDVDPARAPDAIEPGDGVRLRRPGRPVQLAADVAHDRLHVALDHDGLVAGELEQFCRVLYEPVLARRERRRRRQRRAEPAHGGPQQQPDRDHALHGGVEHHVAVAAAQRVDQRDRKGRIARLADPVVLQHVWIRQDPQAPRA